MAMPKTLPVHVDRFADALAAEGVDLPRHAVARLLAAALGHRDHNSLKAAAARGDLDPPRAERLGDMDAPDGTALRVLHDPVADMPYAVAVESLSDRVRAASFGLTPYGNVVDMRPAETRAAPRREATSGAANMRRPEGPAFDPVATLARILDDAVRRGVTRVFLYGGERGHGVRFIHCANPDYGLTEGEPMALLASLREACGDTVEAPRTAHFTLFRDEGAWVGRFEGGPCPHPGTVACEHSTFAGSWSATIDLDEAVDNWKSTLTRDVASAAGIPDALAATAVALAADRDVRRCLGLVDFDPTERGDKVILPSTRDATAMAVLLRGWELDASPAAGHPTRTGTVAETFSAHLAEGRWRGRLEIGAVTKVFPGSPTGSIGVMGRLAGERFAEQAFAAAAWKGAALDPTRHQRFVIPRETLGAASSTMARAVVTHGPTRDGGLYLEWVLEPPVDDEAAKAAAITARGACVAFVTDDGVAVDGPRVASHEGVVQAGFRCVFAREKTPGRPSLDSFWHGRERVRRAGGVLDVVRSEGPTLEVMAHLPLDFLHGKPTEEWEPAVRHMLSAPR